MTLRLSCTELYPIYITRDESEFGFGFVADVPDELATALLTANQAFFDTQARLRAYLRAVDRDETAYQHHAEISRKRLERGQSRPRRRPHPNHC